MEILAGEKRAEGEISVVLERQRAPAEVARHVRSVFWVVRRPPTSAEMTLLLVMC